MLVKLAYELFVCDLIGLNELRPGGIFETLIQQYFTE